MRTSLTGRFTLYRNVLAVTGGLTFLQAAAAALSVVVAIGLKANGASSFVIGVIGSAYAGGFLLGAILSPREIGRIGHIRAFSVFAAIATLASLAFVIGFHVLFWALLELVLGLCVSGLMAAGESWVADSAPSQERGKILAFYSLISKAGAIAGPFIVGLASLPSGQFLLVGALFVMAMLPIAGTNRAQPELASAKPFGPRKVWQIAPTGAVAAFMAGAVNNAIGQLYPVFAAAQRPEAPVEAAAELNFAILAGTMVFIWPSGVLSDRFDRRLVIGALALTGSLASIGIYFAALADLQLGVLAAAFVFGGGSLSYYAIAIAHAVDRAEAREATSMMAGILMLWGIGSLFGPVLAGGLMSAGAGAGGVFLFATGALFLLAVFTMTRAARTEAVSSEEKAPWSATTETSFAIAEIDPRGDDDQLDLFDWRYSPGSSLSES